MLIYSFQSWSVKQCIFYDILIQISYDSRFFFSLAFETIKIFGGENVHLPHIHTWVIIECQWFDLHSTIAEQFQSDYNIWNVQHQKHISNPNQIQLAINEFYEMQVEN